MLTRGKCSVLGVRACWWRGWLKYVCVLFECGSRGCHSKRHISPLDSLVQALCNELRFDNRPAVWVKGVSACGGCQLARAAVDRVWVLFGNGSLNTLQVHTILFSFWEIAAQQWGRGCIIPWGGRATLSELHLGFSSWGSGVTASGVNTFLLCLLLSLSLSFPGNLVAAAACKDRGHGNILYSCTFLQALWWVVYSQLCFKRGTSAYRQPKRNTRANTNVLP